jgi:predicted acetyltransferase
VAADVALVPPGERPALAVLMRDYLAEMAAILSIAKRDEYPQLDRYWSEPGYWPYWILDRGSKVGFALVRKIDENAFDMAEFFVSRGARRAGIGISAARKIIASHAGRWRIVQWEANTNAIAFWHRVLEPYAYDEISTATDALRREQRFVVPAA